MRKTEYKKGGEGGACDKPGLGIANVCIILNKRVIEGERKIIQDRGYDRFSMLVIELTGIDCV